MSCAGPGSAARVTQRREARPSSSQTGFWARRATAAITGATADTTPGAMAADTTAAMVVMAAASAETAGRRLWWPWRWPSVNEELQRLVDFVGQGRSDAAEAWARARAEKGEAEAQFLMGYLTFGEKRVDFRTPCEWPYRVAARITPRLCSISRESMSSKIAGIGSLTFSRTRPRRPHPRPGRPPNRVQGSSRRPPLRPGRQVCLDVSIDR